MSDTIPVRRLFAGLCSFYIPGLGQLVRARPLAAIGFFAFAATVWYAGWKLKSGGFSIITDAFLLPFAIVMHLFSAVDAYRRGPHGDDED